MPSSERLPSRKLEFAEGLCGPCQHLAAADLRHRQLMYVCSVTANVSQLTEAGIPRASNDVRRFLRQYGKVVEVDLVNTDGDVETVRGDNCWLHLASGLGFAWAGNFVKE